MLKALFRAPPTVADLRDGLDTAEADVAAARANLSEQALALAEQVPGAEENHRKAEAELAAAERRHATIAQALEAAEKREAERAADREAKRIKAAWDKAA